MYELVHLWFQYDQIILSIPMGFMMIHCPCSEQLLGDDPCPIQGQKGDPPKPLAQLAWLIILITMVNAYIYICI